MEEPQHIFGVRTTATSQDEGRLKVSIPKKKHKKLRSIVNKYCK